jgi:hypothetical protein
LAEYLKERGVWEFPSGEFLPNRDPKKPPFEKKAIIKYGKAVPRWTLAEIGIALTSEIPELLQFGQDSGVDISALKKRIDELNLDRNRAAHETRMVYAEIERLRDDWLGITDRNGGAFGALLPSGCLPR